jgi:hypothetical protein
MTTNPPPLQEPIADNQGRVTRVWLRWFESVKENINEIDGEGA